MKATTYSRYGSERVLQLTELPDPLPEDDRVLIRVRAAGVDRGAWHVMTGTPYVARLAFGLRRPKSRSLGMDVAGTVEAVGSAVTRFQVGDEVFGAGDGTFAELALAREKHLAPKPAAATFEQAAALPTSGVTALQALRGRVTPGTRVLILGAGGGVGHFAVQVAKNLGAVVTAATSSPEFATSLGADHVIDYRTESISGEYDLILDVGGRRPARVLRGLLVRGGTVVFVGGEGGGTLLGGLGRQLGAAITGPLHRKRFVTFLSQLTLADIDELATMVAAGTLAATVDSTYPLAQTADAIRHVSSGRAKGKVVVVPTP